jgi:sirohydrochlorin cobaltochelatase
MNKPTQRLAGLLCASLLACSAGAATQDAQAAARTDEYGVLVMAHGGDDQWNAEVASALAPVAKDMPLEVAFGMADAVSLQEAVRKLEDRGVQRIGVVRLFVSGESWYERTEQILGVAPGAPPKPTGDADSGHAGHGAHGVPGHSMAFWRLDTDARFALSKEGLAEAPEMGDVLAVRARKLSTEPAREDVLILAHGPGDDAENARWIANIDARADAVRAALPFRRVQVATLREDWPEKRAEAEVRVRDFVEAAARDGGRAIVIPFRVQGFGPYAEVLKGLDYVSDGQGLVPDAEVTRWVERQANTLRVGDFRAPGQAMSP